MSTNNGNLLKKLDDFIQFSLNKYFYVDAWEKLYEVSGDNHYDIISDKSTIPDLIIYNKSFNKNKCFLHTNKNDKYNKFPRVQFLLRPKKFKNYDPSCTYEDEKVEPNTNNDKKAEENKFAPFEFKSIPKEIENKYLNSNYNSEHNMLFDELKEFVKDDRDNSNEIKVKLIYENKNEIINNENNNKIKNIQQRQDNHDKKDKKENNNQEKKSNQGKYEKNSKNNQIQINNMNINFNNNITMNNYLMFQQKMLQNIQYQKYINKMLKNNIYNFNNSHENKFNSFVNKNEIINNNINKPQIINNNINNKTSNTNNENGKNKTINAISYYKNTDGINEKEEFEKYINNLDEILKNYMNKRNWIVMDNRSNIAVNKFNSEELYYFLNTVIGTHENINYSICDLEKDFFFNPIEIHEKLKNMFNKK